MTSAATLDSVAPPVPVNVVPEVAAAETDFSEEEERAWTPSPRCLEILQTLNATFHHETDETFRC